jgi:hypothetical protein
LCKLLNSKYIGTSSLRIFTCTNFYRMNYRYLSYINFLRFIVIEMVDMTCQVHRSTHMDSKKNYFVFLWGYFDSLQQFLRFNQKSKCWKLFGPIIVRKYVEPQGVGPPDLTSGMPDPGWAHVQVAQREHRSYGILRPAAEPQPQVRPAMAGGRRSDVPNRDPANSRAQKRWGGYEEHDEGVLLLGCSPMRGSLKILKMIYILSILSHQCIKFQVQIYYSLAIIKKTIL